MIRSMMAAAGLTLAVSASANTNLGFEAPDAVPGPPNWSSVVGWTPGFPDPTSSLPRAVSSYRGIMPKQGSRFAIIPTGDGVGRYTILQQPLTVGQGQILSGWWGFWSQEVPSFYNDDSYIAVQSGSYGVRLAQADAYTVWDRKWTGWRRFTWTAPASGEFNLIGAARDMGDSGGESFLALDGIRVGASAVPEPAAWAMMVAGFGLVGGALRRRAPRAASA